MTNRINWKNGASRALLALLATALLPVRSSRADAVYAWGYNYYGVFGNGTTTSSNTPTAVSNLASGVTVIDAGQFIGLGVQNGVLYSWGWGGFGELGNGISTTNNSNSPVLVTGMSSGVTAIAASESDGLALQNGGVYAWGRNAAGELGDGILTSSSTPVAVTGMSSGVTAISGGEADFYALKNGGIYAWGDNHDYQLGNGSNAVLSDTPLPVTGLSSGVTAIAGGYEHALAIRNGGVYAWGYNLDGELGNGTYTDGKTPVAVSSLSSGVTAIAAGTYHSLAIRNGNVYAWGDDRYGDLGNGTTTDSTTPILVDPTALSNIVAVAAGYESSYALSSDGALWVWGYNGLGQLGLGTTNSEYLTPQELFAPAGYKFTSISIHPDGQFALATVAPEPEPVALSLLALAGVAFLRRPRRRGGLCGTARS